MPLMQRCFQTTAALLLFAFPAAAGITYDFRSTTTGLSNQTVAGRVHAEGKSVRVDIATGDGVLFKNGSFVVSSNGGMNMTVVDPAAKTFYQIDLAQLFGGADALLEQLGDVKMEVRDPKVSITGGADAGVLEGFPAKKSNVATAYELAVSAFGQPLTVRMQLDSDIWWTDQLSADFTNFLQMRGLRTGLEAIDKLIAAQSAAIHGFPLKQVTTTTISLGGHDMTTTTTSVVRDVKKVDVPAAMFALPEGFTKTANPMETMFRR